MRNWGYRSMTLTVKSDGGSKLAPWAGPILSALIGAAASVAGATYVTGMRAGAQDVIIAEHTQRIGQLEADAKKEQQEGNSAALSVAEKLGGLTATVTNLALGVDRLERRLDGGSPSRQAGQ
jgi:hypothetical protein